ncbi:chemotaxis protein CheW [Vibrio sp. HN007]|uniref:chemotaxis protein CheW n=1 Tax=Vibrio iocasae TaxID=3098914 RepID=UPI0035D42CC8
MGLIQSGSESERDFVTKQGFNRFLLVDIGSELFGIPVSSVREVIEYTNTTSVPMCAGIIQGVINVRGSVVPVINAAKRLKLNNDLEHDRYSCVVLYETQLEHLGEFMMLGVLVRRVCSIESVPFSELSTPPAFGTDIPRQFIWQMTQFDNCLCSLLDMKAFLNVREINNTIKESQKHYFINYNR